MPLPFRRRLFLAAVGLGTLPVAAALVLLALQMRSAASPAGLGQALDEIAATGGGLIAQVDTAALDSAGRAALTTHVTTIARRTRLAHRAATLSRTAAAGLAAVTLLVAALVVAGSLVLARRWSRYVSTPVEELVDWVGRVARREPLPVAHAGGAPEFVALRDAIHQLADALERVRQQELEQERLRAFRETARHVAHEMRGPVAAARLAMHQLAAGERDPALQVLGDETARLEQMAQEFAEFGRLPEGPETAVDVEELVETVVAASTATCPVSRNIERGLLVRGHYEPLRRAVENVVRNAVDFTGPAGIEIVGRRTAGAIEIRVRDFGPGVPEDAKERIFDPYVTTRPGGTGLGLALARQTVTAHGGRVAVEDAAGGGATFVITLPGAP
ncbi:MAG: HAMP domain-containing histidine kinase [Candidatus Krumholzibacteria bacterium]|nr:HAMP domain-containing histidine kinase [Candidatus Krumholzibacteria bacterium]